MKSLVKELFIGVLLLMVVVFTLGILFYDSMPNNKATPTSITYTADTAVTTTIQQIAEEKSNSTTNSSSSSDSSGLDIAPGKQRNPASGHCESSCPRNRHRVHLPWFPFHQDCPAALPCAPQQFFVR